MTSILTSSKNDPYVFCSTLHGLSNGVYRFSMRCVVLEISRGGLKSPPAGSMLAQTPAGARVKIQENQFAFHFTYFRSCSGKTEAVFLRNLSACWLTFLARHSKAVQFGSRNVTSVQTTEQTAFSKVSLLLTLYGILADILNRK